MTTKASNPATLELEASILGAVFFDNAALATARKYLPTGKEFSKAANGHIYSVMISLADQGEPLDLGTVSAELEKLGLLKECGGLDYLAELSMAMPTAANVEAHSRRVKEAHLRTKTFYELKSLVTQRLNETPLSEWCTDAIKKLQEIQAEARQESKEEQSPLRDSVLDYRGLLQAEIPERRTILAWLPEGSLAMVYAPRGLGKTFFGISLAAAIASGLPFMKWEIVKPCGVLYIDGEMPFADVRERLTGFLSSPPPRPLLILSHEVFYRESEADLIITDDRIQAEIFSYLDDNPEIRVLIIDNLSALARIREDKGDDWRECFLPFMLQLRRRGVALLLIHHSGKNGEQRGTGAREDHLDISIRLSKADEGHKDGAYFRVDFMKHRGVFGKTVEPFTAKLMKVDDGHLTWTLKDADEDTETRLLKLIEEVGGMSVTDAAEELGVSKGTISKARKRLTEKGLLKMGTGREHMELAK